MEAKPRERLLAVADELFYARGLHAVGIDEIIAKSGAAKATLYAHFATKDDLIAAYLQRRSDEWRQLMSSVLDARPLTPAARIDTIFRVLADGCASPGFRGCPFINAAAEYPDPQHPARRIGAEQRLWVQSLFRAAAREARWRNADVLADQLTLLYDAALTDSQLDGTAVPAQHARSAARVLVQAAAGAAPRRSRRAAGDR